MQEPITLKEFTTGVHVFVTDVLGMSYTIAANHITSVYRLTQVAVIYSSDYFKFFKNNKSNHIKSVTSVNLTLKTYTYVSRKAVKVHCE